MRSGLAHATADYVAPGAGPVDPPVDPVDPPVAPPAPGGPSNPSNPDGGIALGGATLPPAVPALAAGFLLVAGAVVFAVSRRRGPRR